MTLAGLSTGVLADESVPRENQTQIPWSQISSFEEKARALTTALSTGELEKAKALFFPLEAFKRLKAIDRPEQYHKQLTLWYQDDLRREQKGLKAPLRFAAFQLGSCKWKEKGTEYNHIAYWSCYKSKIKMLDGNKEKVELEIRTLINFGNEWFVTHLGPIPKD